MKNIFLKFNLAAFVAMLLFLVSGCTYNGKVNSTHAPASEIMNNKKLSGLTGVYISNELKDLNTVITPTGMVCSANKYPLDIGDAIKGSIVALSEDIFENYYLAGSKSDFKKGVKRLVAFELEDFSPNLTFAQGYWSGQAQANAEMIIDFASINPNDNRFCFN